MIEVKKRTYSREEVGNFELWTNQSKMLDGVHDIENMIDTLIQCVKKHPEDFTKEDKEFIFKEEVSIKKFLYKEIKSEAYNEYDENGKLVWN